MTVVTGSADNERMRLRALAASGGLLLCSGCLVLFHDPDGGTGGTSSGPSGSGNASSSTTLSVSNAMATSSSGGHGGCEDDGGVCLEPAPRGWQGPVSLGAQGGCVDLPGTVVATVFGTDPGSAPSCQCVPDGPACTPPGVKIGASSCANPTTSLNGAIEPGVCTLQTSNFDVQSLEVSGSPSPIEAPCVGQPGEVAPPPSYVSQTDACELPAQCDRGLACAPRGDACIYQVGQALMGCPADSIYLHQHRPQIQVSYPDCNCGGATARGGNCAGQIVASQVPTCALGETIPTLLGCNDLDTRPNPLYLDYQPSIPPSCSPGSWNSDSQPVQLCCTY